jgi:hypothetical protein
MNLAAMHPLGQALWGGAESCGDHGRGALS